MVELVVRTQGALASGLMDYTSRRSKRLPDRPHALDAYLGTPNENEIT
jgi:hypothetical protein